MKILVKMLMALNQTVMQPRLQLLIAESCLGLLHARAHPVSLLEMPYRRIG